MPLTFDLAPVACLQYLLLTDNDEKVPNTAACPVGVSTPQCSPGILLCTACLITSSNSHAACMHHHNPDGLHSLAGFFDEANLPELLPNITALPHACCPGYFCPPILTCMIPCPLGASCPRYGKLGNHSTLNIIAQRAPCVQHMSVCVLLFLTQQFATHCMPTYLLPLWSPGSQPHLHGPHADTSRVTAYVQFDAHQMALDCIPTKVQVIAFEAYYQ